MHIVKFYNTEDGYGWCSNFYKTDPLKIDGEIWETSEQYFQAMKFRGKHASKKSIEYSNIIKNADSPMKVKALGSQKKYSYADKWKINKKNDNRLINDIIEEYQNVKIRKDWEKVKVNIMIKAVLYKFSKTRLKQKLADISDDVFFVEHTTRDNIWADGGDGGTGKKGSNFLGKILTVVFHVLKHGNCDHMSKALKKAVKIAKEEKKRKDTPQVFKILSWNMNGIRSNVLSKGKYKICDQEIEIDPSTNLGQIIVNYDPDILCFQETRCGDELSKCLKVKGYYQYWNGSKKDGFRSGNRYSGVAVWTKIKPLRILDFFPTLKDQEGRMIYMEFDMFSLLTIYAPNTGTNFDYRINTWDPAVLDFLKKCHRKGNKLIICGDFNVARNPIDVFWGNPASKSYDKDAITGKTQKAGYTDEERKDFEKFLDAGYIDVYRHFYPDEEGAYTWWNPRMPAFRSSNKGWRIDYFVVSENLIDSVKNIEILRNAGLETRPQASDHAPLLMYIDLK